MNKDEKFMAKWKPIHEKGVIKYIIKDSLIYLFVLAILTIILIFVFPYNKQRAAYIISEALLLYFLCVIAQIISCTKKEDRYKEIINSTKV